MLKRCLWMAMTFLAIAIAGYALMNVFVPARRADFVDDLFAEKALRSMGHLTTGGIALAVGAFQFNSRLRNNRPAFHRLLGKIYVVTVLIGGVAALLMAPFSSGGMAGHLGFGVLAVLWLITTTAAYWHARAANFDDHQRWMIRSYALCWAAVTLRIYLVIAGVAGGYDEQFYPVIAWLAWVPNLIVAEWLFVRAVKASP
jgi:uncharacterized membrane protein